MTETEPVATFRNLEEKDVSVLVEIEAQSARQYDPYLDLTVTDNSAWTPLDYEYVLSERNTRGIVVEEGSFLVAVLVYELEREGYRIRRLLVRPEARRSGFGTAVLTWLLNKAEKSHKRNVISAAVDERDLDTCRFFSSLGFDAKLLRSAWDAPCDYIEFTYSIAIEELTEREV